MYLSEYTKNPKDSFLLVLFLKGMLAYKKILLL